MSEEKAPQADGEAGLLTLIDLMPQMVWLTDAAGNTLFVNFYWTDYSGLSLEQTQLRGWFSIVHEDERASVQASWSAALAEGRFTETELRCCRASDNEYRYHLIRQVAVRDAAGTITHWMGIGLDIQDRKAIEAALREREEQLQVVVEGAGIATWKWDPLQDRILYQRNVDTMYGFTGHLSTYAQLKPFIHPDDLPHNLAAIEKSIASGNNLEIEYRVCRPDGSVIWVAAIASVVRDEDGTLAFAGIKMDISGRKRAEEGLRESEGRYKALAEAGPQFVWVNRADGYTTYVNPQWTAYTGLSQEETTGAGWARVLHPDDRERVFQTHREAVAKGTIHENQLRYRRARDGEYRWFIIRSTPLHDENGIIRNWLGVAMDIHAQKQAEDALRVSEERFRLASEAMRGMVYEWDVPTGRVMHSQGIFDLVGIHPHQVPANLDWWRQRVHPDDQKNIDRLFNQALQSRSALYSAEYRIRHEEGHYVWIWDSSSLVFDENGQMTRMVGCAISIDKRKKTEEENQLLLREAQEANRLKDEFLAIVSHELRTPLNAILGWSHLANSGSLRSEEIPHALEIIERNARAQAQIVEDILDMARVVTGNMRIDIAPVNLEAVTREVVESVRPSADAKNITLQQKYELNLPFLPGDAGRLRQVTWNLLSNAIKFTPDGGMVSLAVSQNQALMQLEVKDTGQGINPDFLPFVFDRFRQADSGTTRRHGGLGVGLSLVRHLVEAHGGSIKVDSRGPGEGTTFTVFLPLRAIESRLTSTLQEAPPEQAPVPGAMLTRSQLAGTRILIVEDAPDTLHLLASLLRQQGVLVSTASDAKQARLEIQTQSPDILISDLGLPGEDGYALLSWLQDWSKIQNRPVRSVALTAYADITERTRALCAGFAAFLTKPIEATELIKTLTSVLNQSD